MSEYEGSTSLPSLGRSKSGSTQSAHEWSLHLMRALCAEFFGR
jgi:hypothetical protein